MEMKSKNNGYESPTLDSEMDKNPIDESRITSPAELYEPLRCFICLSLSKNPLLLNCCDCLTCGKCISDWFKRGKLCPKCRSKNPKTETPNKFIMRLFGNLRMQCRFPSCKENVSYDNLEKHEKNCEFNENRTVECEKCHLQVIWRDKIEHDCVDALVQLVNKLNLEIETQKKEKEDQVKLINTGMELLPVPSDKKDIILEILSNFRIHPHPLTATNRNLFFCDCCNKQYFLKESQYCSNCDFDLCMDCFNYIKGKREFNGNHSHELKIKDNFRNAWACDICNKHYRPASLSWRCTECDFDLCLKCRFIN